jgi:hypothetical protein
VVRGSREPRVRCRNLIAAALMVALTASAIWTQVGFGSEPPTPRFLAAGYCTEAACVKIRPTYIAITSADGADLSGLGSTATHYTAIRWRWGSKRASGRAVIDVDPCGCAASDDIPSAELTVRLTNPKRLGGRLLFSVMTFVDAKPLRGKHLWKPGIDGYPRRYHVVWSDRTYLLQAPGL